MSNILESKSNMAKKNNLINDKKENTQSIKKKESKRELLDLNKKIEKKLKSSFLIIDKKRDITSADEVYELRRIFKNKERAKSSKIKIGHSGTLDPKVTGILVIGLGKGTRALEYILLSKKVYETEIIFHKKVSRISFKKVLKKFTGIITQMPPVKSAVKREERQREVYNLDLTFFAGDGRSAKFVSAVERGTYIRTLCHDMGLELGTGAHMGDLKRIQAGVFSNTNSKVIKTKEIKRLYLSEDLKDKKELLEYFYNTEELFERLSKEAKVKKVFVKEEAVKYVSAGNAVRFYNIDFEKTLENILEKEPKKFSKTKKNNKKIKHKAKIFEKGQKVSVWCGQKVLAVGLLEKDIKNDLKKQTQDSDWGQFVEDEVLVKLKKVF